jgi:hypothetical protein
MLPAAIELKAPAERRALQGELEEEGLDAAIAVSEAMAMMLCPRIDKAKVHMELQHFTNKKMPLGAAATDHLRALIAGHMRHLARVFSSHQRPSENRCGKHRWVCTLRRLHSPIPTGNQCLAASIWDWR